MFSLILENESGDQLTFGHGSPFTVTEIQGLNPPDATINTTQIAMIDGGKFNSSKLNMRTINIAFAIEYEAAKNRIEVYKVLKSKQWIKFHYIGDYRNVWIEGYIQSIDITYFDMKQIVTCSILCPSPYFKEAQEIVNNLTNIIDLFHFPFFSAVSKNLLQNYATSRTVNGIAYTVNADGSVTADGYATDTSRLFIDVAAQDFLRKGAEYILSGCPEGGSENGYQLMLAYNGGSEGEFYDVGEGVTITLPTSVSTATILIHIESGVTVNNLVFYPMVRAANITDDSYEPYSSEPTKTLVFGNITNDIGMVIENDGDVDTGIIIVLYARTAVTNPKVYDYITKDYIGVEYEMQAGDQITIDTRKGEKSVTLLRSGVETNLFNYLMEGSTWLQLDANGSTFVDEVDSGEVSNLNLTIEHYNLYEGV